MAKIIENAAATTNATSNATPTIPALDLSSVGKVWEAVKRYNLTENDTIKLFVSVLSSEALASQSAKLVPDAVIDVIKASHKDAHRVDYVKKASALIAWKDSKGKETTVQDALAIVNQQLSLIAAAIAPLASEIKIVSDADGTIKIAPASRRGAPSNGERASSESVRYNWSALAQRMEADGMYLETTIAKKTYKIESVNGMFFVEGVVALDGLKNPMKAEDTKTLTAFINGLKRAVDPSRASFTTSPRECKLYSREGKHLTEGCDDYLSDWMKANIA